MLILFDIDGTLITSRAEVSDGGSRDGVGTASMIEAGRRLYGANFNFTGIEIAGRLDVLIWRDAAKHNGILNWEAEHGRFRVEYAKSLRARLEAGAPVRALPGTKQLVQKIADAPEMTLGLLTGNYPETGRMKLEAAGFDTSKFRVGAWGCEGASRRDLPPRAIRAHCEMIGDEIDPARVIIIGDTPHDIDCAQAHGCKSIGVATGSFSVNALRDSGADLALENLLETEMILRWLLQSPAATSK